MSTAQRAAVLIVWALSASVSAAEFAAAQEARVAQNTVLHGQPAGASPPTATLDAGSSCVLISRVVNASGAWWYVEAGSRKGWVREDQLEGAAPEIPPTPTAQPIPPPPPPPPPPSLERTAVPASAASPITGQGRPRVRPEPDTLALDTGAHELDFAAAINQGTVEAGPFGEADYKSASFSVAYGYFVTAHHELGLLVSFDWLDFDDGDPVREWIAGPRYTLNFPSRGSTIVPFVSAEYVWLSGDSDGEGYEAGLGFRALVTDSISLNSRAYYQVLEREDQSFGFFPVDLENTEYGLRFGFSWLIH